MAALLKSDDLKAPQSPFAVPIFRNIWLGSMASNFGGLIQSVGASWMMVSLHASPQMIALVQTSTTLPIMLLSLWAGALADNMNRRTILIAAQGFMLLVSLVLSLLAWLGLVTPWLLLLMTFLVGCGTAINAPAWQASVGDMVPRQLLPAAVAYNSMGFNIARSAGPALGGVIVAISGVAAAFFVNAISYVGLICVLARWRPRYPAAMLPRERLVDAVEAGIRYVRLSPPIRRVLLRALVFGIGASAIPAMMPVIASRINGGGPLTYGLLLGCFGIGAVLGAYASGWLRHNFSTENVTRVSTLAMIFASVAVGLSHSLPLTLLFLIPAGAGWVLALSTFNVSVQLAAPRWVAARALALYQMSNFGGMAIGSWLFGYLANFGGTGVSLYAAAATMFCSLLLGVIVPLLPVTAANLAPLQQWEAPQISIPLEARSGPIAITIEYRIAEQDVTAFVSLMRERKRIRMRDGARGWTLLRDLNNTELWVERYYAPTWIDFIRINQRRTQADLVNGEEVRALRLDHGTPVVHRMIEHDVGSAQQREEPAIISEAMTDTTRSS